MDRFSVSCTPSLSVAEDFMGAASCDNSEDGPDREPAPDWGHNRIRNPHSVIEKLLRRLGRPNAL